MTIPLPPPDASGGYMIIKYTNGTITHRMRVHVLPFDKTSATLAYITPPAGGDAGVTATFTALVAKFLNFYKTTWTFSLDAVFQIVSGSPVEVFGWTAPSNQTGASGLAEGIAEAYQAFHFRSTAGGRAQVFLYSVAAWAYAAAASVTANSAGSDSQKLVALMTGATTGIVAHDGHALTAPAHVTYGLNRKLRRRVGNA